MTYEERLVRYENEKRELRLMALPAAEYAKRIREIARKYKI